MVTRTIKAERRWRRIVEDWRRSGLSAPQYAKGRGISAGMIYVWSSRLAKQDADASIAAEPSPTFLPVAIVEEASASFSQRSSTLEVVLPGGELIRVAPGADLSHLSRVVAALRGGST